MTCYNVGFLILIKKYTPHQNTLTLTHVRADECVYVTECVLALLQMPASEGCNTRKEKT